MMYYELIEQLRETSIDFGESDHVSVMLIEATDAIEELQKQLNNGEIENIKLREEFAKYRGKNVTTNYMRCYFCGAPLRWEADFSFDDYGIDDQQGVVSNYSCDNCDTSYQIFKPFKIDESEDN